MNGRGWISIKEGRALEETETPCEGGERFLKAGTGTKRVIFGRIHKGGVVSKLNSPTGFISSKILKWS